MYVQILDFFLDLGIIFTLYTHYTGDKLASFFSAVPQISLPQSHYLDTLEMKEICK